MKILDSSCVSQMNTVGMSVNEESGQYYAVSLHEGGRHAISRLMSNYETGKFRKNSNYKNKV